MTTLHSASRFLLLGVLLLLHTSAQAGGNGNPAAATTFAQGQSAIRFIENKGQIKQTNGEEAPFVGFVLERGGTKLFLLKSGGIAYQFEKFHYPEGYQELMRERHPSREQQTQLDELRKQVRLETYRMDMNLLGANPNATIITEGRSEDYTNYYNHNVLDVHHYRKVTYKDVYPGIDWVVYTTEKGMKYDFIVSPGVDPNQIRLQFTHHEELRIDEQGNLIHGNRMGSFTEEAPISFQGSAQVDTRYVLEGDVLSFQLGAYDPNQTLTIDPNRIWGTYYGGSGLDDGRALSIDASGNVYMAGNTSSSTGIASGGHQNIYWDSFDSYLVKFNSSGVRLWATYYGGGGQEITTGVSLDISSNIYLTGYTKSNSRISSSGHQNSYSSKWDAFLVKFNSSGLLIWATYYGDIEDDYSRAVTTDVFGNVYIGGETLSQNNIATVGSHQDTLNDKIGYNDTFIAKFNPNGVRLWATYYGGYGEDLARDIKSDAQGNVYLALRTRGDTIPAQGHQRYPGWDYDAFLAKFDSTGVAQWATYYGGEESDNVTGIEIDEQGNIYMSGSTSSIDSISLNGFQNTLNGISDAYLVKFNSLGIRQWATYFGGAGREASMGTGLDGFGNIYVCGTTTSDNGIYFRGYQDSIAGGYEAFFMKFNSSGVRQWGSYFGGPSNDTPLGCTADRIGNFYLCGFTESLTGIFFRGFQSTFRGQQDAFLVKFDSTITIPTSVSPQIEFENNLSLTLYPNPTQSGVVNIKAQDLTSPELHVRVLDLTGRVLYTQQFRGNVGEDLNEQLTLNLPSGTYLVQTTGGLTATQRLVVVE